jgi:hypothetical protein
MIRQISVTVLAASLSLFALPTMPSATAVASRGDGYCPSERYSSDPDCAREGAQQLNKSRRDEYPRCRNWRAGQPRPAGCRRSTAVLASAESDKRNQFPDGRPPQPGHLG